jgi:type I restriction enzyme R subunit
MTPEQRARQQIDTLLHHADWDVQDREQMNLFAAATPGVAVREAHLKTGYADYLLFVQGKALGIIEAKRVGVPLSGVEAQSARYAVGLRPPMQAWRPQTPLPFRYESTGVETYFTNGLDPTPVPWIRMGNCPLTRSRCGRGMRHGWRRRRVNSSARSNGGGWTKLPGTSA